MLDQQALFSGNSQSEGRGGGLPPTGYHPPRGGQMPLGLDRCFELSWGGVGLSCLLTAQLPAWKCFGEDLCLGEGMGDVQTRSLRE